MTKECSECGSNQIVSLGHGIQCEGCGNVIIEDNDG